MFGILDQPAFKTAINRFQTFLWSYDLIDGSRQDIEHEKP